MQQLFPLMMVGKLGEDTVLLASLVFIEHQSHSQKPCLFTLRNFTHMQRRDMYSRSFHMLYIPMQTRCLSLVSWIQKRKKKYWWCEKHYKSKNYSQESFIVVVLGEFIAETTVSSTVSIQATSVLYVEGYMLVNIVLRGSYLILSFSFFVIIKKFYFNAVFPLLNAKGGFLNILSYMIAL